MAAKTLGIKFPIEDDINSNRLLQMDATQKDSIKSQLYFLLLTPVGSRWYNPDFGTNLYKYIFEPKDTLTNEGIISELNIAISKYIPNLTITKLDSQNGSSNYSIIVTVQFSYIESTYRDSDSLTIEFNQIR